MSTPKRLSKVLTIVFLALTSAAAPLFSETSAPPRYDKSESSNYRDIFDQAVYYEGLQYFHLERLYRDLFGKKKRALDVNVYDEVPDSTFFTNRHGRERMSAAALKQGPAVTSGPDASGPWSIYKGKFAGVSSGFFIKDGRGEKYLLKFDPLDYVELATGAEVVTSRFYHALGYNVPQYTITRFRKDQLTVAPDARIYDDTGFRKKLTPEKLEGYLLFIPEMPDGQYQASASKILDGEVLGPMEFQGRRTDDSDDPVNHQDRREIRALQVFGYWLNGTDIRESNSLDVVEMIDGQPRIRHYLIDFNSGLGATPLGPMPSHFGHEHIIDYGEILKGFLTFGLWKKPWQKRWDEAGREIQSPTVGYFDNRYSKANRFKTQLPYYPFKDLTRADGFWAAKIIMKFTDEDIREVVSAGEYTDSKTPEHLTQVLTERRDLIGRYWFKQANPLDAFELHGNEIRFEDLAVRHGFESEGSSTYHFKVIGKKGRKGVILAQDQTQEKAFTLQSEWLNQFPAIHLLIRTQRSGEEKPGPWVRVEIESEAGGGARLAGILHQD